MILRGGTFGPVATNTYVVVDDAAVQLGVVDVAEGRQHGVAGGRRAHMNIRA